MSYILLFFLLLLLLLLLLQSPLFTHPPTPCFRYFCNNGVDRQYVNLRLENYEGLSENRVINNVFFCLLDFKRCVDDFGRHHT